MIPLLIGFLSGIISGMGIGGGTILIPALVIFMGIPQGTAQGVNLIFFFPTAIMALITHFRNKSIEMKIVIPLVVYGIMGALIGSFLATTIDFVLLQKLFAGFIFVMGIWELWKSKSGQ